METLKNIQLEQSKKVDPSHIMQVGMGFWASKTLLTAVKLEVFFTSGRQTLNRSRT